MTMKDRLVKVLNELKYIGKVRNQTDFAAQLGYGKTYLSRIINGHEEVTNILLKEMETLFSVNKYWMETGEGEMFITETKSNAKDLGSVSETESSYTTKSGNQFTKLTEGAYLMQTKFVPVKAHASYLTGWGDEEYIENLTDFPVVVNDIHKGTYRTFEAAGESMNDGTNQSIEPHDKVTGRLINRSLWKSNFHIKKYPDYIVVHREHGIMVKRIVKHDTEKGIIICHSLNPDKHKYPDFEIRLDDCLQIYNIVIVTKERK